MSLGRFIAGYFLAAIPAIFLGMILGRLPIVWQVLTRLSKCCALFHLLRGHRLSFFGLELEICLAIVIIFIAAFFPILLTTVAGVTKIDTFLSEDCRKS